MISGSASAVVRVVAERASAPRNGSARRSPAPHCGRWYPHWGARPRRPRRRRSSPPSASRAALPRFQLRHQPLAAVAAADSVGAAARESADTGCSLRPHRARCAPSGARCPASKQRCCGRCRCIRGKRRCSAIWCPRGSSLCEQGQILLVVAVADHKKGAVHPGGIHASTSGVVLLGPSSKVRQTHFSGREGEAGVPASDAATAGAAGEKGLRIRCGGELVQLQPTGARTGISHPAANAASAAASSPPHSPMRPPVCPQKVSYTNPSFALGAVPQAGFPRTNDVIARKAAFACALRCYYKDET